MIVVTIPWGDGTSDKLTVTYSGDVGDSRLTVVSDPSFTAVERTQTVKLKTTGGILLATLTVTQKRRDRNFSKDFSKDFG